MTQVKHTDSYCSHCKTPMVICGTCGNNTCNGMYGRVGDEPDVICPDCPSAYAQMYAKSEETEDPPV